MKKYKCIICGHVYDPAEGDPHTDTPPGTSFEDLADDWVCPICRVGKEYYVELD
jgi:rubredoxin